MWISRNALGLAALGASLLAGAPPASADARGIRLAKQFSMGYLQFNILEHEKLIEKHAKAAGLGDVKVAWATFNGKDLFFPELHDRPGS